MSSVQGASYLGSCWGSLLVCYCWLFFFCSFIFGEQEGTLDWSSTHVTHKWRWVSDTCLVRIPGFQWPLYIIISARHLLLAGSEFGALQSCYTRNHLPEFLTLYSFKTRHDIKIWSRPKKPLPHMCWVYLHMDSNRFYKRSLENVFAPFWHSLIIVDLKIWIKTRFLGGLHNFINTECCHFEGTKYY